jgi:hypothetical protein
MRNAHDGIDEPEQWWKGDDPGMIVIGSVHEPGLATLQRTATLTRRQSAMATITKARSV